jgi:hypothetical protein
MLSRREPRARERGIDLPCFRLLPPRLCLLALRAVWSLALRRFLCAKRALLLSSRTPGVETIASSDKIDTFTFRVDGSTHDAKVKQLRCGFTEVLKSGWWPFVIN